LILSDEQLDRDIEVHWREEEYYQPSEKFIAQANLNDPTTYDKMSLENFPHYFSAYADLLDWYKTYDTILDSSNPPFWRWFVGGQLNASYNCVDRHLPTASGKVAYYFVAEREEDPIVAVSYQELYPDESLLSMFEEEFGKPFGDMVPINSIGDKTEYSIILRIRETSGGTTFIEPMKSFGKIIGNYDGKDCEAILRTVKGDQAIL